MHPAIRIVAVPPRGYHLTIESAADKRVSDLMTRNVITCVAEDRYAGIMAVMVSRHLRHIPVVKDGKFISMVSVRDLLKLRLDEVQSEADAMRSYIAGSP